MGRGRKSQLPRDQQDYLESHYAEFIQIKPHLDNFWGRVERGWTSKWPVEVRLGLPLLNPDGVAIEESGRSQAEKLAIATAEEKERKSIHNWFYNRQSKEKRDINSSNLPSSSNGALQEILTALGGGPRPRRLQRREIWQKRNGGVISAALKEAGFDELMGSTYAGESETARKERVSKGRREQQSLRMRVVTQLMLEASEEETAAVEEEYKKQEKSLKSVSVSQQTPEEYQRRTAVDKYVERTAGLVGSTVLVGPIPNLGGKIGTQTYCHGVTPAGHTLDQAHSGWTDQVIKPLHQFGKKIFDHDPRRKRALGAQDQSDLDITPSANAGDGSASPSSTVTTPLAAPTSSTPEVPSDTPPTALPSVQTAPGAPNSSDAAPQASSDSSGATTTLFWPVDEDLGLDNQYPPLDLDLFHISSSHPPPPHAGVSPGDPILPSSMLDDSPPAERPTEPVSSSTTIASVSPATVATQGSAAPSPGSITRPTLFPSTWETGREWIFPSSTPSTPVLGPCTPTSFARHPPPAPVSAPPPVRRLASVSGRLPPGSASAPSTPTASRIGTTDLLHQVTKPSPLRLTHTADHNMSTSPPPTPSTTSPPTSTDTVAVPSALSMTPPATVPDAQTPALAPTSTISLPVGRTVPSSTPSAAHAPSSTPPTSTPTASPVVPITTVTHRSALTAEDFPESRPLSNAPSAPKTSQVAVSGRGGGRGRGGGGGRGGGRGRGRGRGGARGGGAGGGVVDTGYLLRVDPEKGNVWQIGTVSRQRVKEIRAAEKARDAAATAAARDRDHGIFVLPPPPPGHAALPAGPAALGARMPPPEPRVLGLRGPRERTNTAKYVAQKKRTMEEVRTDALQRKADKAAEKAAEAAKKKEVKAGQKRKANAENLQPGPSKRRR